MYMVEKIIDTNGTMMRITFSKLIKPFALLSSNVKRPREMARRNKV